MKKIALISLLIPVLSVGCKDDDDGSPADASAKIDVAKDMSVSGNEAGAAEAGNDASGDGASFVALEAPPAGQGVQIKMLSALAPAVETERCMFYKVPPEGMAVWKSETKFSGGSHHV